jgi:hypothetical protein
MIPTHSLFTYRVSTDGTGRESRIEMACSLRIDWNKYLKRRSLLECLDFGDSAEQYDCNTPDVTGGITIT